MRDERNQIRVRGNGAVRAPHKSDPLQLGDLPFKLGHELAQCACKPWTHVASL